MLEVEGESEQSRQIEDVIFEDAAESQEKKDCSLEIWLTWI